MHTKGPWSVDEAGDIASGSDLVCVIYSVSDEDRQLMASAPDLLGALERVLAARQAQDEWDDRDTTKRFNAMLDEAEAADEAARAAIARATGAGA